MTEDRSDDLTQIAWLIAMIVFVLGILILMPSVGPNQNDIAGVSDVDALR